MLKDLLQNIKNFQVYKIKIGETGFKYRVKYIDPARTLDTYSYIDIPRMFAKSFDDSFIPADQLLLVDKAPDSTDYVPTCQSVESVNLLCDKLKIAIQM